MTYEGPVIDVHTHPTGSLPSSLAAVGPDELRAASRRLGVEHCLALYMARRDEPEQTVAGNDEVLALSGSDGFFRPVCSVHPMDGELALRELERVAALGARWLKLHPNTQGFDVAAPEVSTVVGRAGELGMTVLFDSYSPFDPGQPGKFLQLATEQPTTRLVLAHLLGPRFPEAIVYAIAREHFPDMAANVYFDVSFVAPTYAAGPYAEQLVWTIRQIGVERFLYGSDYPMYAPERALAAFRSLGFDDDEERAILYDNAAPMLETRPAATAQES